VWTSDDGIEESGFSQSGNVRQRELRQRDRPRMLVSTDQSRRAADLFLVSFLILFMELACIRWFGSTVVFLTFFTNIALLAAFLGISVGCLAASSRRSLIETVLPTLLVGMTIACVVLYVFTMFSTVMIDVGGQGSPQQVFFGTEYRARDVTRFVVPLEAVAGVFFVLIALAFVGLGQVMGRAFTSLPNRVFAYTVNIAGSLAGIAAFAFVCYLRAPPSVWFATVCALTLYFLPRRTLPQICLSMAVLVLLAIAGNIVPISETIWSPYYKILYEPASRLIATNNIGHQVMVNVDEAGPAYALPHLLNRDSGGGAFADVLVIGAGSGNDVAAALRQGVRHVDAVEIDPAIKDLGSLYHPNQPYSDPRVSIHIDDGRSFVRRTERKYDLVVYALVDSLVLHSGFSSIRLESFLFTHEAFADIRRILKPDGVFVAYNFYRQPWLVGRLQSMMTAAFGRPPLVMTLPYQANVRADDASVPFTLVLSGNGVTPSRIQRAFAANQSFWLNERATRNDGVNGFAPAQPSDDPNWHRIGLATVRGRPHDLDASDDWPFFYLRDRLVPALNVRGAVVLAVLSFAILVPFMPERRVRPDWHMFFMGAGFMLLETKGVVHLALLFGSTWLVNSIVFFAILVMVLCSNLWVLVVRPARLWPYYLLLACSLGVAIAVPMNTFLNLPGAARVVVSCAVVFVPVFFAGVIFGTVFRDSKTPDLALGSNVGGAILGGLSENLSLLIGFNNLCVVALLFYALSVIGLRRTPEL
jgi:SAM-dependent methyltransferase